MSQKVVNLEKKNFSLVDFLITNALVIILIGLGVVATIYNRNFIGVANFKNMGTNIGPRFLIALGVSGCLITRGTDLSAGRMAALGACITGTLVQRSDYSGKFFPDLGDTNILLVLLFILLVCGCFGFMNGIVISKLKVPPFIATLGMQTIVYGVCMLYTGSIPLGGFRTDFTSIATSSFLEIPIIVWIGLIVGVAMWFLYNKTRHGKYMYAIGGNENAAEVSGVNVGIAILKIYTLAAILYGAGGFLLAAKAGGATVGTGLGYELEAIASCTIGGVSTTGGIGRVSGVLLGVMIFEILKSSLQFLQVDSSVQYIIQGLVIVIAVALDLRKYLAKK